MGIKTRLCALPIKPATRSQPSRYSTAPQLDEVDKKRTAYLSEKPNPADEQAVELTNRLLATAAVELHNAYLPQLRNVYAPIDPFIEYPTGFNADNNIRFMNITKWIVDPNEDSLEKLVNVYDVLSDEECNIALVLIEPAQAPRYSLQSSIVTMPVTTSTPIIFPGACRMP